MTYLNVGAEEVFESMSDDEWSEDEFLSDETYFGEEYLGKNDQTTGVWVDEGPFGYEVSCDDHGVVERDLGRRADATDAARRHYYSEHQGGYDG